MSKIYQLQDDIKAAMGLTTPENTGWYSCRCPICQNQRKTGGFLFEENSIAYQCFRASCPSNCVLTEGEYVSKKFRTLVDAIGVQIPIELLTSSKKKSKLPDLVDDSTYEPHKYNQVNAPFTYVNLEDADSGVADLWKDYFNSRRVDYSTFRMITSGDYEGNVAIPMFFFDRLIGHTVVTPDQYIKLYDGNTDVIYLPDRTIPNTPIVVEGVLDARSIPYGVGIGSSHISKKQAWFLRNKKPIMIPDRSGNDFIDQFHRYDWLISLPDWGVKDVNEAVQTYGVIETMNRIKHGIIDNATEARIRYKLWLEN